MSAPRLLNPLGSGEINEKRLYIDGLAIEYDCPVCGTTQVWDNDYLNFPKYNEPDVIWLCCGNYECDGELGVHYQLNIDVVPLKLTLQSED